MVVETQVKINQESTEVILCEMENPNRKYGLLTEVAYDINSMIFNPTEVEF
jgi:hypothetical protein